MKAEFAVNKGMSESLHSEKPFKAAHFFFIECMCATFHPICSSLMISLSHYCTNLSFIHHTFGCHDNISIPLLYLSSMPQCEKS